MQGAAAGKIFFAILRHRNISSRLFRRCMLMKRIEAIIRSEKLDATITALQKLGIPATIYESKGVGKGEKYTIKYGLGTGSAKMLYSDRKTVVTIVDDERVKEAVDAIKSSAGTGGSSSGIIFVSAVEESIVF